MGAGLVNGSEDTGRLDNIVGASFAPRNIRRILNSSLISYRRCRELTDTYTLAVNLDRLTVNVQLAALGLDFALESAVSRVIFELYGV